MTRRTLVLLVGCTVVFTALLAEPVPSAAQTRTEGAKTFTPPRTADGRPDLQGVWTYSTITPLQRPAEFAGKEFLTEKEAADFERRAFEVNNKDRRDAAPGTVTDVGRAYNEFWWDRGSKVVETRRTSLVIDPSDGKIPAMTPAARERAAAMAAAVGSVATPGGRPPGVDDGAEGGVDGRGGRADGPEDRGLDERCITRSAPRLPGAYNNNYQIQQTPEHVAILQEMNYEVRIIPLDGRPHVQPHVRQWLGDSRGRWEGDTLVVETTNFTDRTSFRGSSRDMRLVERFTRSGPDTITYEFTVTDSNTWTRPWTASYPLTRTPELIYEYACHEGNYGMPNLLAGSRAVEKGR